MLPSISGLYDRCDLITSIPDTLPLVVALVPHTLHLHSAAGLAPGILQGGQSPHTCETHHLRHPVPGLLPHQHVVPVRKRTGDGTSSLGLCILELNTLLMQNLQNLTTEEDRMLGSIVSRLGLLTDVCRTSREKICMVWLANLATALLRGGGY